MRRTERPVRQTSPGHDPLDGIRHAEIIDYLCRNVPRAWQVLMAPSNYIYDDRDHDRSVDIENQASALRIRFNSETDWNSAMEILRQLIRLDREACAMSIGSRIDGREIMGACAAACDCPGRMR